MRFALGKKWNINTRYTTLKLAITRGFFHRISAPLKKKIMLTVLKPEFVDLSNVTEKRFSATEILVIRIPLLRTDQIFVAKLN